MGAYGVAVEKEFQFRGQAERTTSVYHYAISAPLEADFDNLAEAVVARDRLAHHSSFNYKIVRVFGPTEGHKDDNKMRLIKDLTGSGSRVGNGADTYPELTACVQIYVGRSPVKNRKVYVRKFIHLNKFFDPGSSVSTGLLAAAERTFFANWMDGNKTITRNAVSFAMVTPKMMDVPDDSPAQCLTYARIRQLHQ